MSSSITCLCRKCGYDIGLFEKVYYWQLCGKCNDEVSRLQAQNKKLRAALEHIKSCADKGTKLYEVCEKALNSNK